MPLGPDSGHLGCMAAVLHTVDAMTMLVLPVALLSWWYCQGKAWVHCWSSWQCLDTLVYTYCAKWVDRLSWHPVVCSAVLTLAASHALWTGVLKCLRFASGLSMT
jgi:hypothetical protein